MKFTMLLLTDHDKWNIILAEYVTKSQQKLFLDTVK